MSATPRGIDGPIVSKAIGTKWLEVVNSLYLEIFLLAASSAAAPTTEDVCGREDCATVSVTVASQRRHRPPCHGMSVSPSGRFPSVLEMPRGSLMLGTPASVRLRLIISFKYACLANLPGPRPQDKPCEPSAVINPPQGHMCGSQVLAPKRRHAAILIASSSSLFLCLIFYNLFYLVFY